MGGAKRRVKKLFEKVREEVNSVIHDVEKQWLHKIDEICSGIETATKNNDSGVAKKRKISHGCGIYESLDDVIRNHKEVSERDEGLKAMEAGTNLPNLDLPKLRMAMGQIMGELKLSSSSFNPPQTYVPNVLEVLFDAVVHDDVKTFSNTMENEKFPPNASKFILNYSFPNENWPKGEGAQSDKLLQLAAAKGSFGILDYLVDTSFNLDTVDRNGKHIANYLIDKESGKCSFTERIILKLFEIERVRKSYNPDWMLLFATRGGLFTFTQNLIEKYGASVNCKTKGKHYSVLQLSIEAKSKPVFDLLMKHSPNLSHVDHLGQNCLHTACSVNFHEVIDDMLKKDAKLYEVSDLKNQSPLILALNGDHVESFKAVAKYCDITKKLKEWQRLAELEGATKILKFLQTIPHVPVLK